ncbi:plasmid pRiA4b ORF-3 family protein [Stutzerimonas tarimensis]|uniref:Plasmid pRiA4b ORF-3 family protein n=1 Tax=Stutzerimonas tarimensis TaxID=1507735 RepID=A0ABV7TBK2_9GAMM
MAFVTTPVWITLVVQLEPLHINPPIWRRLVVNGDSSLRKLHHFIQASMGWSSQHLHEFTVGDNTYAPPDLDPSLSMSLDDRKLKLFKLKAGDRLRYLYDLGDSWQHVIAVEKVEKAPQAGTFCEVLGGERACPPEDIGGMPGYLDLLERIRTQPYSAETRERLLDLGGDFDPELFDWRAANAAVQRICNNLWG